MLTEPRSHLIYLFCLFVVCFCLKALVKAFFSPDWTGRHTDYACNIGHLKARKLWKSDCLCIVVSACVYPVVRLLALVQLLLLLKSGPSFGAKHFQSFRWDLQTFVSCLSSCEILPLVLWELKYVTVVLFWDIYPWVLEKNHRIIKYLEVKGIHEDHQVQLLTWNEATEELNHIFKSVVQTRLEHW